MQKKLDTAISEDEGSVENLDDKDTDENSYSSFEKHRMLITPGGPFSALTKSMVSEEILNKLESLKEKPDSQAELYDEFGFKVEGGDCPEKNYSRLHFTPLIEDPQHRLEKFLLLSFFVS